MPSSFKDVVSSDLGKDDVYSWTESHDNGARLWRFAPEDRGIEYSVLNKVVSNQDSYEDAYLIAMPKKKAKKKEHRQDH